MILALLLAGWLGIPDPSFGVTDACPALTVTVPSGSRPPSTVPAGTTLLLVGSRTGSQTVTFAGTATAPSCILGAPGNTWTGADGITVRGSYGIVGGLVLSGGARLSLEGGHHLSARGNSITGTLNMVRTACLGVSGVTDAVLWNNVVTRCGNVASTSDEDAHGISVGRAGPRVWVLENESSYHSGDGANVNPYPYGDSGLYNATRFVYFAGNKLHHNKQTCGWSKGSQDIIWSENVCEDIAASGSSFGQGMGYQYQSQRVWFVRNRISRTGSGIATAGDFNSSGPASIDTYIVDNVFTGITGQGGTTGTWAGAPILLSSDRARTHVVGNVASTSVRGINVPRGLGLYHADNVSLPILSDRPVTPTTREAVYAEFERLYGRSIRPTPPPIPSPTPQPTPTPTPVSSPSPSSEPCVYTSQPSVRYTRADGSQTCPTCADVAEMIYEPGTLKCRVRP